MKFGKHCFLVMKITHICLIWDQTFANLIMKHLFIPDNSD